MCGWRLQLAIDIEGVGFHRTGADHYMCRDLWIGHSGGDQAENFTFTSSEELNGQQYSL